MSRFNWQEMSPEERDAFDRWLPEWQERQRKRGAYWLTPEGRAEIAETWENDADSVPRVLLDALERAEAALATASRERDEATAVLRLVEFTKRSRGPARCPCCNGVTHSIGCTLAAVLRAAAASPDATTAPGEGTPR